ncbi:exosome complex exonuclease RRP41 [Dimargaris cristalligena]|uniref:Ribosomal RNA-processing protein 41 n=1 Tax=Dimargaris cristalligena TaxID=215637 RepID=A0A4P9ZQV5_9FUNG|nr:exosome complex exonuclease RRP41 [Dimargaris cristalligena]|eukprot:RKP35518.1 exosome complex exonuclease RRP41 [Dimargaris cristalligena]
MSRQELLSPEGLRIDGRRANELRRTVCKQSVLTQADGSAYYEQGNTKVLAAIYGPREPRLRSNTLNDRAFVNVEFKVAPFSTNERRKRSKGDRRILEIASAVRQTFESVIVATVYPRSQIDVFLHLLQDDGGNVQACINATTLALIDAGIPMTEYICACSAGYIDETPVLDLNHTEESSFETPDLTIAVMPRSGKVTLLQMESRLEITRLEDTMLLATEGCKQIQRIMDSVVRENTRDLVEKYGQ